MTDTTDQAIQTEQPGQSEQPFFNIQRIYLKDASLEQPNSPQIFLEQDMPEVGVEVKLEAAQLAERVFECTVTCTVTAKVKGNVAFLVEGKQAGIFDIHNVPPAELSAVLGIGCPSIIFPYLRANISDLVTRAGFPPVHIAEMNFQAMYQQRVEAEAQAQGLAPDGTPIAAGGEPGLARTH